MFLVKFLLLNVFILVMQIPYSGSFLRLTTSKYKTFSIIQNKMFSGIIEEIAQCKSLFKSNSIILWDGSVSEGVELIVKLNSDSNILTDAYIGCSISVNGVCLTATSINHESNEFTVGLAPETLRKTNLKSLETGSPVNIERAMKFDARNSGHFVQGHVDCTGEIIEKYQELDSLWFKVKLPEEIIKFINIKGFIAVDGTSLTICDVNILDSWFTFMLIPHTQQNVIIPKKNIGDHVNIEVDILAKMVDRSFNGIYERLLNIEKSILSKDTK